MNGRGIAWPGNGSLLAAWRYCEERLLSEPTIEEFDRYRRVKRILKAGSLPPHRRSILVAQRYAGDRLLTQRYGRELLGQACSQAEIAAADLPGMRLVARERRTPAPLEGLIDLFPNACRARLQASLEQAVIPEIVPPTEHHVGRVLALIGEPYRLLAASALLAASVESLGPGMHALYVTIAERLDQVLACVDHLDRSAVTAALERAVENDLDRPMAWSFYQLGGMMERAARFLIATLGADAPALIDGFPAMHRDYPRFRARMRRFIDEGDASRREAKRNRVAALAPEFDRMMIAADNRAAQAESILVAVSKARKAFSEGGIDGGLVECLGPVVRPDGSLGDGQQIVRFALRREADLVAAALNHNPKDPTILAANYYRRYRLDLACREHLVYLETVPALPDGECVEPFFVEPIRLGLLDDGLGLTCEQEEKRRRLLDASGLSLATAAVEGILHHGRDQRVIVRALRRASGTVSPVIVPITNLVHGLMIARVVVGMGVRTGARIGETRQLRNGCLAKEALNGRNRYVAMLRPKGHDDDVAYEIHPSTLEQLRRLQRLAHARWFPHEFEAGKPTVPVVPLREPRRPSAYPGRYLLVGPKGVLSRAELNVLVRFLFVGLADVLPHDLRYLFITGLGLAGVSLKEMRVAARHSPGSYSTPKYDVSDEVRRASSGNVASSLEHVS